MSASESLVEPVPSKKPQTQIWLPLTARIFPILGLNLFRVLDQQMKSNKKCLKIGLFKKFSEAYHTNEC